MTISTGFLNASGGVPSYDAQAMLLLESLDLAAASATDPLQSRPGVRPHAAGSMKVTVTGLAYTCSPGLAVVSKAAEGAKGEYRVALDAPVTGSIPAAGSSPRQDLVCLRVRDSDVDGSGVRAADVLYVQGTPGASAPAPTQPPGTLLLASINVPVSGSPTVSDRRTFTVASGGLLPVTGTGQYPPNPHVGQAVFDSSRNAVFVWTGNAWRPEVDSSTAGTLLLGGVRLSWGSITLRVPTGKSVITGAVTFPAPYSTPPKVFANNSHSQVAFYATAYNPTATGCGIALLNRDASSTSASGAAPVSWFAIGPV